MNTSWKSVLVALTKFAIPVAIIAYLLIWHVGPEKWNELSEQPKDYFLLVLALFVALAAMSISFARWCLLVRCQGIELTMLEAFRLGAISFLLSFVAPGSVGGDLFKAIFLAQRRPGKRVEAVASVIVDRGCGLYALLLLVAIALLLTNPTEAESGNIAWIKTSTAILVGVGTVVLAFLVLGGRAVDRLILWGSDLKFVGGIVKRVGPPLRMFHNHPVTFGVSILMSIGVQTLLAVSVYLIAIGLYSTAPTFVEHMVIVPLGMLASAIPISPAGLGVFEGALDAFYRFIPAEPTPVSGTLVALTFEVVKVVMAVVGTVFYWTANEEVRHSLEVAEEEAQPA